MDEPRDSYTGSMRSRSVRHRMTRIMWYYLYVESKKNGVIFKWTYFQSRSRITDVENKLRVTKGLKGVINWEIVVNIYALLYIR